MKCCSRSCFVGLAAVAIVAGSLAFAQNSPQSKDKPAPPSRPAPAATPQKDMAPPKGDHQMIDMQACIEAATPGEMHKHLTNNVGVWHGKVTMWMPGANEPTQSECVTTISSMLDGRFTKAETTGEMPGMGTFTGFGIYGFDNVAQQFQSTWIDSMGTGMANGIGTLSSDGKTMTWVLTYNCPMTKKPATMREVDRMTGKDTMTMEMYGADPTTGKEMKMMEIAYTRKPAPARAAGAPTR